MQSCEAAQRRMRGAQVGFPLQMLTENTDTDRNVWRWMGGGGRRTMDGWLPYMWDELRLSNEGEGESREGKIV